MLWGWQKCNRIDADDTYSTVYKHCTGERTQNISETKIGKVDILPQTEEWRTWLRGCARVSNNLQIDYIPSVSVKSQIIDFQGKIWSETASGVVNSITQKLLDILLRERKKKKKTLPRFKKKCYF